jgi:hypothetical protein
MIRLRLGCGQVRIPRQNESTPTAKDLDFERAAALRDRITQLRDSVGEKLADVEVNPYKPGGKRSRRHKGGSQIPRPKRQT